MSLLYEMLSSLFSFIFIMLWFAVPQLFFWPPDLNSFSLPLPLLPCTHLWDRHLHVGDGSYPTWYSLIFLHTFNLCLNRILLISLTYLCGHDFVFLPCFLWDGVSRVVCNIEAVNAALIFVCWHSAVFCTILCFFHNHSKSCTCLFNNCWALTEIWRTLQMTHLSWED